MSRKYAGPNCVAGENVRRTRASVAPRFSKQCGLPRARTRAHLPDLVRDAVDRAVQRAGDADHDLVYLRVAVWRRHLRA
jgi:hypothetical protein